MKRFYVLIMFVLGLMTACGGKNPKPEEMALKLARSFVEDLNAGEYTACLELLDPAHSLNLTPERLSSMWLNTQMKAGSYKSEISSSSVKSDQFYIVEIRAEHTNMTVIYTLEYKIDFKKTHVLTELSVEAEKPETRAAYELPAGIIEEDIKVSEASGYPLDGKLALPSSISNDAQIPAVVLIHDKGEWDMDGSVFDNKPFRDIAHYLAQNGIAVLRYDKITYAYPEGLDKPFDEILTADIETIYDGIYARMFLQSDNRIDQGKVFVLGHGLGGSLAAEICELGDYAGYISMAGSPRNPIELAYDRELYMTALTGGDTEAAASLMGGDVETYLSLVGMEREDAEATRILGISGNYLLKMMENPPSDYLSQNVPALILQGTNDFETFYDRDFELYKAFLAGNPSAVFRLYEGLNHMFMWSTMERPDIRDYMPVGHVEESVLTDIVTWVAGY